MRRPRRRRRDAIGAILIALAVISLTALAAASVMLRPPPVDPASNCRTDRPILAHTIILVDATDKLEPRHRKRLRAAIDTERARLAPYDKLTILRINPGAPNEPRPIFSKCLPRDGRQSNPLFENPKLAQTRWEEDVGAALRAAISRAASRPGAQTSPIVQSIFAIAADPDFSPAIARRRLVLVSDLLEHEAGGFSLYRADAGFDAFKAMRPERAAAPDLDGVAVRITMLDRDGAGALQGRAKSAFWARFIEESGAASVSWDPAP